MKSYFFNKFALRVAPLKNIGSNYRELPPKFIYILVNIIDNWKNLLMLL